MKRKLIYKSPNGGFVLADVTLMSVLEMDKVVHSEEYKELKKTLYIKELIKENNYTLESVSSAINDIEKQLSDYDPDEYGDDPSEPGYYATNYIEPKLFELQDVMRYLKGE